MTLLARRGAFTRFRSGTGFAPLLIGIVPKDALDGRIKGIHGGPVMFDVPTLYALGVILCFCVFATS
jgi:hypothetical protein